MIRITTLGRLEIRLGEGAAPVLTSQPKRAALLAYLACADPRGLHRRDKLLAAFWPELSEAKARRALSQAMYAIRRELGIELFETRGDHEVGLDWSQVTCDAVELREALAAGRSEDAVALYRGEFLSGFHVPGAPNFGQWIDTTRAQLQERVSDAAWVLAETEHDPVHSVRLARRAAAFSPYDEGVVRRLISVHLAHDDRVGALDAFEEYATRLAKEYQLEPAGETQALVEGIERRAESPSLMHRPLPTAPHDTEGADVSVPTAHPGRVRWAWTLIGVAGIALFFTITRKPASLPAIPNSYIVFPFTVTAGDLGRCGRVASVQPR